MRALSFVLLSYFEEFLDGVLDLVLDESELLIALIAKDLAEDSDVVVVRGVLPNTIDDRRCPLDD